MDQIIGGFQTVIILLFLANFIPAVIAHERKLPGNMLAIVYVLIVASLVLSWTVVFGILLWVAAIVVALAAKPATVAKPD